MHDTRDGPVDRVPLGDLAGSIATALADLRCVSSAARHGDQLAAVIVDTHAAGLRRVIELAADPRVLTADPDLAEVLWVHEVAGDGVAIDTMATRVDTLRSSIEQSGVPGLLDAADRLIEGLTELYGRTIERAIELLHDDGQSESLVASLDDPLISALLLAHGMHPVPLAERIEIVLAACAQSLGEHAGTVELIEASDSDGRVRLSISGGDEKQRWRTRLTVERAVRDLVADALDVEIEGADAEPRGTPGPTIIPLTSIGRRRPTRWAALPGVAGLSDGDVLRVSIDSGDFVACRVGSDFFVAPDPFVTNTLRLVATSPPTVEAADGARLELSDPLPTHVQGDVVEVLLT